MVQIDIHSGPSSEKRASSSGTACRMKTSGGLFNFLSGAHRRAPQWMQSAGLEWAHRLYLEPRRLLVRYATTNLIATWALLSKTRHTSQ